MTSPLHLTTCTPDLCSLACPVRIADIRSRAWGADTIAPTAPQPDRSSAPSPGGDLLDRLYPKGA